MRSDDLLLSYYGDDLTGSTDAMEALALSGVPTVLFLREPSEAERARFAGVRAIGLAGTSRSETPEWMDAHLPEAFSWLASLRAPLCHYKVCSTFDSSPTRGNIARAMTIGRTVFRQDFVPLLVGAPQLRRYTAFGTLFAAYRDAIWRIDRHPVASRHPVTPMLEADLRLHLAKQSDANVALADLVCLNAADADRRIDALLAEKPDALLLDVIDAGTQRAAGEQLWRLRERGGRFAVGSSGVEYALLAAWKAAGLVPGTAAFPPPGPAERIAAVSGSCSPTTERQIRHALAHGFDPVALDAALLAGADDADLHGTMEAVLAQAATSLDAGRSVLLYTALGPATDAGAAIEAKPDGRHNIGRHLGFLLQTLVRRHDLTRAVIAGGDTASHALAALQGHALTTLLPLPRTPGSPLCTLHSDDRETDGLQIALKGGQIGTDAYFCDIRDGIA